MLEKALIIQEDHQLIALLKALSFVKYHCQNEECRELAGSPIINQLLVAIKAALKPSLEQQGLSDEARLGWVAIEHYPAAINSIKSHLANIEDWSALSETTQLQIIAAFIQPMSYQSKTATELLQWRNGISS